MGIAAKTDVDHHDPNDSEEAGQQPPWHVRSGGDGTLSRGGPKQGARPDRTHDRRQDPHTLRAGERPNAPVPPDRCWLSHLCDRPPGFHGFLQPVRPWKTLAKWLTGVISRGVRGLSRTT